MVSSWALNPMQDTQRLALSSSPKAYFKNHPSLKAARHVKFRKKRTLVLPFYLTFSLHMKWDLWCYDSRGFNIFCHQTSYWNLVSVKAVLRRVLGANRPCNSALMAEVNSAFKRRSALLHLQTLSSSARGGPMTSPSEDVACNTPSWSRSMDFNGENCWALTYTFHPPKPMSTNYPVCVTGLFAKLQ